VALRKQFFLAKKNQKTFIPQGVSGGATDAPMRYSLLGPAARVPPFYKKERCLASHQPAPPLIAIRTI
jgi:hypothetical protein